MGPVLRQGALVIAICSAFSGAIIAFLPALVLATITLFYNSAGGVLVFLGGLVNILPHVPAAGAGAGSLPVFQRLGTDNGTILVRSAVGTVACLIASVAMAASWRKQDGGAWMVFGALCVVGAIGGGRIVAFAVLPAILIAVVLGAGKVLGARR